MDIRADFRSAEFQLNRLIGYAKTFNEYNHGDWSRLKNNEDFSNVYDYESEIQRPLTYLYQVGRDTAVSMSGQLLSFNYIDEFPTLISFVDSFSGGRLDRISEFKLISQAAKEVCDALINAPWAVRQMINLFDQQVSLLEAARQTIQSLRLTEIYKFEVGGDAPLREESSYAKVLNSIHASGLMFERLPAVYSDKGEEALRDNILVSLSSLVFLSTTGETFNLKGKTDILVRESGENVYIGECKFWNGPSVFLQTIDQLFSYLTWRDVNVGLVIFVRRADFSGTIRTMEETIITHPRFLKKIYARNDSWHDYQFSTVGDPNRLINVAVMLYNLR
ncbi:hypothetical protein [Pseudomonas umsongensis]|uniref:hypothetical protein n=1 Tax=Pseudomonas umsongensis TaxID=198618 RepID=UPI0003603EA5|nr:hypothetical protein [Pseudomonas umsongensis]